MTLTARYRPGAVRTPFVDREDLLGVVDESLAEAGSPPLLVLTGVGGIGKSRLLHEVTRREMASTSQDRSSSPIATALLNLQEPAQRSPLAALATLRTQYGRAGVRFDRFDVAYAVWWQRLNPQVVLSRERFPLAVASETISEVLQEVSGIPVFGSALRVVDILARRLKRWQVMRHDPTLQELDSLTHDQLGDAVTYLFAQELNPHECYLLCVDAYEALVGARPGRVSFVDAWLRDLVAQLDRGLVIMASREPLGWERHNQDWANRIREVPVAALPFEARVELLTALGIQATDEAAEVAEASAGVPYYLHLAREAGPAAGAFPRLEERFLHHVDPAMVRLLELLSVARLFDREIFVRLAVHFGMPSDAITWETLIGYSFVSSAGTDTLQLHQLMAQAIRARLSGPVRQELHGVLHEAWRDRASAADSAHAWREAAYHATRVTTPPAALLVDYADRMMALEGQAGLKALLADQPGQPRLHALWRAESALLVGDTAAALAETASVDRELPAQADDIDARLAIAAAHAYRIHGDTSEAQARYGEIWSTYQGTVALDAGTWYADLHMAQGRFIDAVAVAEEVASRCPADRHTVQGDVARLRFLAHRFAFDLDRAATHLHHAQECYSNSGHAVGLANIATNRVELLALTDPAAAIDAADAAISAQQRLSADHELGKVYTAVAVAHLGLGQREPAARALDQAVTVLDRCGYRSGRARAELVRALWHAQAGAPEPAQHSVAWAVAELQAAEVYPTLIMVAAELLAQLGRADPAVTSAGTRAGTRVQAPQGAAGLAAAIRNLVSRTIRVGWDDLYAAAQADDQVLSGFYHRNVRVGDHLVRAPITGAPQMDLQIWPEPAVLALAARHVPSAPTLRFASDAPPRYQVHDWIDGQILDVVAPRGTPVPAGVITACASLFAQLAQVPADELPPLPEDWPADGDCAGFATRLLALTKSVYARFADEYGQLWNDLEIPADPFAASRFDQLSPRPFRLLHCDVHRKNILLQPTDDGPVYRFLDWELACFGDPVYDLAVHLHKMGYLPEEEDAACHGWQTACRTEQWPRWREDLRAYREHEWVKSAIVDSVRYAQLLATAPAQRKAQVASLTAKLAAARRAWEQPSPVDPERVSAALLAAAGRRQGDR